MCAFGACAAEASEVGSVSAPVVYGADNRLDVYEAPPLYDGNARRSMVALIETANLDVSDAADVHVRPEAGTLASTAAVCAGERFRNQPTAARCSGTLIDDDLVLTAGHCARTLDECRALYFVFGYVMDSDTSLATITRSDVFTCRDLVARTEVEVEGGQRVDFAVVQLDRPATPRFTPLPVDTSIPATLGAAVTVIGAGSGLPLKVDSGGTVRTAGANSFSVDTDTFGGNSGSGVLSNAGSVIGILVKGRQDYVEDGSCYRVNVLPSAAGVFEEVTNAGRALGALCDPMGAGWRSARLCGPAASCGDGRCSGTETPALCALDCPAARCGDSVCQLGEDTACVMDCVPRVPFPTIPSGWTCPIGFYSNHDGCHCGCGTPDLDCQDTWQDVRGCAADSFCSARSGQCVSPTEWTCIDTHYEDGMCDCECGTRVDPDCADPSAPRYACDDPPSDAICAVTSPGTRRRAPFALASTMGVAALAWARRRRRSSPAPFTAPPA